MSAAHSLAVGAEHLRHLGIRAVIAKPFDLDALVALLQRCAPLPKV